MTGAKMREAREPESVGFEGQLEEIETIVERLESGEVELEEALALFERGVARLRQAGQLLERAEGRVEELIASVTKDALAGEMVGEAGTREVEDEEA
jgi:exodeoxyribonuclease VII small subunit